MALLPGVRLGHGEPVRVTDMLGAEAASIESTVAVVPALAPASWTPRLPYLPGLRTLPLAASA